MRKYLLFLLLPLLLMGCVEQEELKELPAKEPVFSPSLSFHDSLYQQDIQYFLEKDLIDSLQYLRFMSLIYRIHPTQHPEHYQDTIHPSYISIFEKIGGADKLTKTWHSKQSVMLSGDYAFQMFFEEWGDAYELKVAIKNHRNSPIKQLSAVIKLYDFTLTSFAQLEFECVGKDCTQYPPENQKVFVVSKKTVTKFWEEDYYDYLLTLVDQDFIFKHTYMNCVYLKIEYEDGFEELRTPKK